MVMLRHLMPGKVRSNAGCWTCRLRRKKCDEKHPECDACKALEITCYFDDEKPTWMDGGARQKDMADKIKSQVRRQAGQRRDRKYMELLEVGTRNVRIDQNEKPVVNGNATANGFDFDGQHSKPATNGANRLTPGSSTTGSSPPETLVNLPQNQTFSDPSGTDESVHLIMVYLDYVFPYLYPFYRPSIFSGGRGWVLETLQRNKTIYHTAMSLASYFFGVMVGAGEETHKGCTERMAKTLQEQLEMGLRELQREMRSMNSRPGGPSIYEQLRVMHGIIQMVVFEISTSNRDNWKVHLEAAIALFFQILPKPEAWYQTVEGLYSPNWTPEVLDFKSPWSTNQAALRFFTASLFHMDVMASISLERPPRLIAYRDIITPCNVSHSCRAQGNTVGPLFMEEFNGLHNWITHAIGDITTLHAWKKEQLKAGTLCIEELTTKGKTLEASMLEKLQVLDSLMDHNKSDTAAMTVAGFLPKLYTAPDITHESSQEFDPALAMYSKVWLNGLLAYLNTVIIGWKPGHPDIRRFTCGVKRVVTKLPNGFCMRAILFPVCVAGCLAMPEDEEIYRGRTQSTESFQVFGAVREVRQIMEEVWSRREELDETWDVAQCLRILGYRCLLA